MLGKRLTTNAVPQFLKMFLTSMPGPHAIADSPARAEGPSVRAHWQAPKVALAERNPGMQCRALLAVPWGRKVCQEERISHRGSGVDRVPCLPGHLIEKEQQLRVLQWKGREDKTKAVC